MIPVIEKTFIRLSNKILNMTQRLRNILITIFSIVSILFIVIYLYPKVRSHISRSLKVESSTLSASGFYYQMSMDQLNHLIVDSNKIILTGYDVTFYNQSREFQIIRMIPERYKNIDKRDSSWTLLDSSYAFEDMAVRTFYNRPLNKKINVSLPFWNCDPEWVALSNNKNEWLLILASGNWKRGEMVYLGFIDVKL